MSVHRCRSAVDSTTAVAARFREETRPLTGHLSRIIRSQAVVDAQERPANSSAQNSLAIFRGDGGNSSRSRQVGVKRSVDDRPTIVLWLISISCLRWPRESTKTPSSSIVFLSRQPARCAEKILIRITLPASTSRVIDAEMWRSYPAVSGAESAQRRQRRRKHEALPERNWFDTSRCIRR